MKYTLPIALGTFSSILCLPSHFNHIRSGHSFATHQRLGRSTPGPMEPQHGRDFHLMVKRSSSSFATNEADLDRILVARSEEDDSIDDCDDDDDDEDDEDNQDDGSGSVVDSQKNSSSPTPDSSSPVNQKNSTTIKPQPVKTKPADSKPADSKPTDSKPESKPDYTKPTDSKPESKPAYTKPTDSKPESKPDYTKPVENVAKPAETKPKTSDTSVSASATVTVGSSKEGSYTSGGGGSVYNGKATFFYQGGVAGACGTVHSDSDYIVAIQSSIYDGGKYCGKKIQVTRTSTGQSITCIGADECPGCVTSFSLDLSVGAFNALGKPDEGLFDIKWEVIS